MVLPVGFILSIFFSPDLDYGIGCIVRGLKRLICCIINKDKHERMAAGMILTILILTVITAALMLALSGLHIINPVLAQIAEIALFAALPDTARIIKRGIRAIRKDVGESEAKEVCVFIADGLNGAIASLIFYMAIGGIWTAVIYRLIYGICTELEKDDDELFAKFARRLRETADFIPCRLAAVFAMCVCRLLGYNYENAIEIFWRDRMNGGLNMGQVCAVFAGALKVRLEKNIDNTNVASFGDDSETADKNSIKAALRIMLLSAVIFVILGSTVRFIFT